MRQLLSKLTTFGVLALGLLTASAALAQNQPQSKPQQEQPQAQQAPGNASAPAPGEQVWTPGPDNTQTQTGQQPQDKTTVPPPPDPYEAGAPPEPPPPPNPSAGSQPSDAAPNGGPVLKRRPLEPIPPPNSRTLDAGLEIHAVLDSPLSTRSARNGDTFTATLVDPLRNRDGEIVVPAGAMLRGQVTDSRKGRMNDPRPDSNGRLGVRFYSLVMGEKEVPLRATLLGVLDRGRVRPTDPEGEVHGRVTGQDVARALGIGGGAGTLLGAMLGSPWKGLAVGLLAGGGYLLATQGQEVSLPANTGLVMRLNQPLTLPMEAYSQEAPKPPED